MFHRSVILFLLSATVLGLVQCDIYRLPSNVRPLRYFLTLEPHFQEPATLLSRIPYNGSVVMELLVLQNTKNITFHQKSLHIDEGSVTLVDASTGKIKISDVWTNKLLETCTIELEDELTKGDNLKLTIGNFYTNLRHVEGFFRAFYMVNDKELRSIAATQFEPTGARLAFPCFDEPAFKANFVVSLIREKGYNSVSNEDLEITEDLGDGRFKDTFKETSVMSTFTLAFAVFDYKHTEKKDRNRVFTRPEAIENGEADYALEVGVKTLQALEEYTGVTFTISKIDQVTIPDEYFGKGAMENWGLVLYRESNILRNKSSTAEELQKTTRLIAHEFAHQWFGNLVTPVWWDYLWLSESFATYFEYYITSLVQPTWRLMDQFVSDVVQWSFFVEQHQYGAYPINFPIKHPGEYPPIETMYRKGASVLRMTEHFLTSDVFRKGLQLYLEHNKFSTAMPSDLYTALQEAVDRAGVNNLLNNMTVEQILKPWHNNGGFPLVTVTRNYENGGITIKQMYLGEKGPRYSGNNPFTKWIIPINYVFSSHGKLDFSKTTADFWLTEENETINHNFPSDGFLLVNKQQTGYYRVNYDLENWQRIIQFMNSDSFTSIHVLNRAQLINDAFDLAEINHIPWEIPFRLCEYLVRENDYIAFSAFYRSLGVYFYRYGDYPNKKEEHFQNYTLPNKDSSNSTEYDPYKEYVKFTLSGVYKNLGLEPKSGDTHLDQLHRTKLQRFSFIL